ncbi:MAG: FkbM family methyltransferase [Flavobacteriales bacterium]|jgi:FkbM family methyltransferase
MQVNLQDGTRIHCVRKPEAKMLDHHVEGYLKHGISIKNNDIVFDVGANVGVFGVRVMQKAENVSVYAFEPIPEIAAALSKNAALHGQGKMVVIEKGVSSSNGIATFTYFPNTPALSTLHPEQWDDNPGAFKEAVKSTMKNPPQNMRWMRWIPSPFAGVIAWFLVRGRKQFSCELITIDEVIKQHSIERIDLLKIDCEGAEWDVLQGVNTENWNKVNAVVAEVHDSNGRLNKTIELLKKHGFTSFEIEQEEGLANSKMFNLFALKK